MSANLHGQDMHGDSGHLVPHHGPAGEVACDPVLDDGAEDDVVQAEGVATRPRGVDVDVSVRIVIGRGRGIRRVDVAC